MDKPKDLNALLADLRQWHADNAKDATVATQTKIPWVLVDYILWTLDRNKLPMTHKPITTRKVRGELWTELLKQRGLPTHLTDRVFAVLKDLEHAEATLDYNRGRYRR